MEKVIAIDPGSIKSAYVVVIDGKPVISDVVKNEELFEYLRQAKGKYTCVLELLPVAGVPFSEHVFRTCIWLGKYETAAELNNMPVVYIGRSEASVCVCGKPDASDRIVRRHLIRRFATFDKNAGRGTREKPDNLYCVKYPAMIALAYAVTWLDKQKAKKQHEKGEP